MNDLNMFVKLLRKKAIKKEAKAPYRNKFIMSPINKTNNNGRQYKITHSMLIKT